MEKLNFYFRVLYSLNVLSIVSINSLMKCRSLNIVSEGNSFDTRCHISSFSFCHISSFSLCLIIFSISLKKSQRFLNLSFGVASISVWTNSDTKTSYLDRTSSKNNSVISFLRWDSRNNAVGEEFPSSCHLHILKITKGKFSPFIFSNSWYFQNQKNFGIKNKKLKLNV